MQLRQETRHQFVIERPQEPALPIRQIVAIGLNYADHAREQGAELPERPLVFTKNIASLSLDGRPIVLPRACADRAQVDYEAELAVIIGRDARDVTRDQVTDVVLGYTAANDVSARWWQKVGGGRQFFRGKSFDTFCPLGPRVRTRAELGDANQLGIRTRLNGELVQDSNTAEMVFSVEDLIVELSRDLTLVAGTVLLTGTPAGVALAQDPQRFLESGDVVEVEINGIGTLTNPVT